jgi:hypothetical protein
VRTTPAVTGGRQPPLGCSAFLLFPVPPIQFPDPPEKFPDLLRREFGQKTEVLQGVADDYPAPECPISRKFPVNSLLIREFAPENGSLLTAPSASSSDERVSGTSARSHWPETPASQRSRGAQRDSEFAQN